MSLVPLNIIVQQIGQPDMEGACEAIECPECDVAVA